jgi:hypothetical protein
MVNPPSKCLGLEFDEKLIYAHQRASVTPFDAVVMTKEA